MSSLFKRAVRVFGIGFLAVLCGGALYWGMHLPEKSMRGIWRLEGYGLLADISTTTINIYEVSSVGSCLHWVTLPANMDLLRRYAGYEFLQNGDGMTVHIAEITNHIRATPVTALPDACLSPPNGTARDTLDVFLATFSQFYPNFDLYDVDWNTRVAAANEQLSLGIPLPKVIRDALVGLEDGHVEVSFGAEGFRPKTSPAWFGERRKYFNVGAAYLESPLIENPEAGIFHGWLPDNVGYIAIVHMGANPPLWRSSVDQARIMRHELAETYRTADALIIDLRYNSGGSDSVALTYASLLSKQPWLAATKAVQINADTLSAFIDVHAYGMPNALTIPAAVLTSQYTVSAAEIGVLALRELPNVTVIGENTSGALSDMMERQLPNGWTFSLPHQVYESPSGVRFEGVGIPADITVPMSLELFSSGTDRILEVAIAALKSP